MDWTLFWQIAGPIIGLLSIGVMVLLFLRSHREKIEIKNANMSVQLLGESETITGIRIEYSFKLLYTKGARDHYVSEVGVRFSRKLWKKLRSYFEIPLEINVPPNSVEPTKLELGKPLDFGEGWLFAIHKGKTINLEEREKLDGIAQKLWHRYKIGWKDTYDKTHWETVNQLRIMRKEKVM